MFNTYNMNILSILNDLTGSVLINFDIRPVLLNKIFEVIIRIVLKFDVCFHRVCI
jgi:hypothetical protein